MSADTLPAPGLLPPPQETRRADADGKAKPRRGAAQGPPTANGVDDLKRLAAQLVAQLGAAKARYLAALLVEQADEAEGRA
jgi:hypothetical protein